MLRLMLRTRQDRQAWALLLPMLIIMLAVTGYPLVSTVRLSFTDAILTGRATVFHWVGWDNFRYVFTDLDFGDAFWRTLYFASVSVAIELVLGVLVLSLVVLFLKTAGNVTSGTDAASIPVIGFAVSDVSKSQVANVLLSTRDVIRALISPLINTNNNPLFVTGLGG